MAKAEDKRSKKNGAANKGGSVHSSAILGEMVWLYSMSDLHRPWPMGSIHQWLLPAILHNQYRLYYKDKRPVGLVTWAYMSKEVETAYVRNTQSLKPVDWKSGDRGWILDFIAPFGDAIRIGHDLKHNIFPNEVGRILKAKPGTDTLQITYIHGANAIDKARDWEQNPTVELGD